MAKMLAKASMRNTNFKKYAGLFRRPPNVANRIRLRRVTSNAPVFNKISYAGLSKWSQRGGLENRLPNRHGGSNPSACAKKHQLFGWCFSIFVFNLSQCVRSEKSSSETNTPLPSLPYKLEFINNYLNSLAYKRSISPP